MRFEDDAIARLRAAPVSRPTMPQVSRAEFIARLVAEQKVRALKFHRPEKP